MREEMTIGAPAVDELWAAAPYPVIITDAEGRVVLMNQAATALLPDGVLPAWLAGAGSRCSGRVGDRGFEARATRLDGGGVVWWLAEDTARREAEDALSSERERTAFMADASTVLLSSLNVDRCMRATVELAARRLADAAVLVAPASGQRLPVVFCGPDGVVGERRVGADPDTVPGLGEALRGFPPVPSRCIPPAAVPDWLMPAGFTGRVGSVVITPLPGHGVPAGALVLLRREDHQVFSDSEEVFARVFAARAGAALSAARLYAEQADITATLMRELLPPRLRHVDGVEFAGGYRAAARSDLVGGDFYDVHAAAEPGAETLVVLGDVCGKGLAAAVLTGKIRNTLHALTSMAHDHQRVLELVNATLLDARSTRFATLVLASVARTGARVRLRLTSAGHPRPLIVRGDGRVEEAETAGTLIGVLPEVASTTFGTELAPGETCLLYTDGVIEARGGPVGDQLFGEERLRVLLGECAGLPAEAVVERVQVAVGQWVGQRGHDDIAVVAITAPRRAHLSAVDGHTRGRFTA